MRMRGTYTESDRSCKRSGLGTINTLLGSTPTSNAIPETDTMEGRDKNVTKGPEGEVVKARESEGEVVGGSREGREGGGKPSPSPEFQTPPSSPPLKREEEKQSMEVDESGQKRGGGSSSEEDQHWGQQQVRER